jgi:pilus assembly protein CpaB
MSLIFLANLVRGYEAEIAKKQLPEETVLVIVAARDLYQGIPITEEDLYAVAIPPRFLPEDVFLSPEHVVGRVPRERILANEMVRGDRLANPESGTGLHVVIPRGLRGISLDLADGRALAGMLSPGNYVDILVTMIPDKVGAKSTTRTLHQAIFVLGVDARMGDETREQALDRRGKQRPTVTLLASPDQAEQLALAHTLGDLTLTLRNDGDVDVDRDLGGGVTVASLRQQLAPAKPVGRVRSPPDPECAALKLITGTEARMIELNCDGSTK